MNLYKVFFDKRSFEVYGDNQYEAQQKAVKLFGLKPKSAYKITIVLLKKNGVDIMHSTSEI